MLKCKDILPQLSAYIDRELPLWEAQMIRWHLRRCQECAFEFMLLMDTSDALKSLNSVATSDKFLRKVMTKASMMSIYERKESNFFQRMIKRFEARFALLKYAFYTLRNKAGVYAMALILLVMLSYFTSAMPRIIYPEITPRQILVKNDVIPVEFITLEELAAVSSGDS